MQATHSYNTYKSVCAVSREHALKSPPGDANGEVLHVSGADTSIISHKIHLFSVAN